MATFDLKLKAVKYFAAGSEETYCFQANLYEGNKKLANVGNSGHGGCNEVHAVDKAAQTRLDEIHNELKKVVAWVHEGEDIYGDLDTKISELMTDHLDVKYFKKFMKKVAILEDSKIYGLKLIDKKFQANTEAYTAQILKNYPDAVILNSLPTEEALKLFKEHRDS